MLSQKNKNRVIEFLREPIILIMILIIVVLAIVLVIVSVTNRDNSDDRYYSEVDPASGETVYYGPSTGGDDSKFQMIGFEEGLIANGMTSDQFFVFKDAITKYAEDNKIDLTRVSYVKNSFNLASSYVFDFSIALNIDETILKVRVDSSKGWKNILGMTVVFWDENGNEIYKISVNDDNICDYLTWCEKLEIDTEAMD